MRIRQIYNSLRKAVLAVLTIALVAAATSKNNYSGFFNALVPDGSNPNYSSAFGTPGSQAGGVFGSGGPRAFQVVGKLTF